jgi:hypothetical protein
MYDCRNSHLTAIPRNIPSHVIAIDASYNNITALYDGSFTGLGNLRAIYMQFSYLHRIQKNAFQDLPYLCILDFYTNNLTTESVDQGVFENIPSIQVLQLAYNYLNGGVPYKEIGSLHSLQTLSLCANDLIPHFPSEFRNLKALQTLTIGCIDASIVNNKSFENLAGLPIHYLHLSFSDNGACFSINGYLLWHFPDLKGLAILTYCGMRYALKPLKLLQFRKMDYLDFRRSVPSDGVQSLKEENLKYLRNICVKNFISRRTKLVWIASMRSSLFMKCLERIDLSRNMLQGILFINALLEATRIKVIDKSYQGRLGPVNYNALNSNDKERGVAVNLTLSKSIEEINFSFTSFAPHPTFTTIWLIGYNLQKVDISYSALEACSNSYGPIIVFFYRV